MAAKTQNPSDKNTEIVKKPSKAEQMAAFKQQITNDLQQVKGLGDLEIYVKPTTFENYRKKVEQLDQLREKHGSHLLEERSLALELYDETGELFFDLDDETDMQFLRDMPFAARQKLSTAIGKANGGYDIPKTLSTTKSD